MVHIHQKILARKLTNHAKIHPAAEKIRTTNLLEEFEQCP